MSFFTRYVFILLLLLPVRVRAQAQSPDQGGVNASSRPADAVGVAPLPFPIYVASKIEGPIAIDGKLIEPVWRQTALGWGLSHALEPNLLCPDPTLFRIGYDDDALYISLACFKRTAPPDLPDHVWKPRESELMDIQAIPRHARERGVAPPINTVQVLISSHGRTITLTYAPPAAPTASLHDALGDHQLKLDMQNAYQGGPDDTLWTSETRITWAQLRFDRPRAGDDWALELYREIRFLSNWSFIAWMRDWAKAEYSRYDMVDRFGRLYFVDSKSPVMQIETFAQAQAARRGRVRVFTTESLLLAGDGKGIITQRYAERLPILRAYEEGIRRQRGQIGCDLPYAPFFTEKEPRAHLQPASQRMSELFKAAGEKPLLDDAACTVARISHAIPEAREGLYTYKKERLYRELPE